MYIKLVTCKYKKSLSTEMCLEPLYQALAALVFIERSSLVHPPTGKSLVSHCRPALAAILAFVGLQWSLWVCGGLNSSWPLCVGGLHWLRGLLLASCLRWPAMVVIGLCWPSLACDGCRWLVGTTWWWCGTVYIKKKKTNQDVLDRRRGGGVVVVLA